MDASKESEVAPMEEPHDGGASPSVRSSLREPTARRASQFEAWTTLLFRQWWVPKSMGMSLLSCEMDVRAGVHTAWSSTGTQMAFFGTYKEVTPHSRLV